MALASHMGEYFGKTLVLEQWGYKKSPEMGISCWNRLYAGTVFRLVFSQPCRVKGVGGLVRIEDPHAWVCSPYGGSSGKTLVSWEIEV